MKFLNLLKDIIIYSFSSIISKGLSFILLPIYTRIFSVSEYGVIDVLSIVVTFSLLLFSLQIDQGFAYFFSTKHSEVEKKSYFNTALFFYMITFLFVALFFGAFSEISAEIFLNSKKYSEVIFYMAIYLFLFSIKYIVTELLKWRGWSKKYAFISVLETFLSFATVILLVGGLKMSLEGIYIAYSITVLVIFIICLFWIKDFINIKYISFKRLKKMYSYSWPLVFSSIAIYILQFTDRIMITKTIDLTSTGLYSLGFKLSNTVNLILIGFRTAWGPFIMKNYRDQETPLITKKVFEQLFVISMIFIIGASFFSIEALVVLTTKPFFSAYKYVPYLSLSILLFTFSAYFSFGLNIFKKTKTIAIINTSIAVLNIALNYLGIKFFGLFGAVIATLISFLVLFSWLMNLSQRFYLVPYNWLLYSRVCAATFILAIIVNYNMPIYLSINWLIFKLIIFITYVYFIINSKLIEEKDIKNLINKIKGLFKKKMKYST